MKPFKDLTQGNGIIRFIISTDHPGDLVGETFVQKGHKICSHLVGLLTFQSWNDGMEGRQERDDKAGGEKLTGDAHWRQNLVGWFENDKEENQGYLSLEWFKGMGVCWHHLPPWERLQKQQKDVQTFSGLLENSVPIFARYKPHYALVYFLPYCFPCQLVHPIG